ncbi:MAG: alpha/beta hydrolase [Micavibrio sp.]|nr:MAG: alpha/beta hydrolase [Micavibrio sp.]
MSFIENHYTGITSQGPHRIVYNDWGPADGFPVICVHGLTGNGHDFDFLAEELIKDGHRIIAVDLPGRGRSDFLANPHDYNYGQYIHDLTALLAHLNLGDPGSIDWIGVSLGGLLGIYLAGMKDTPIRRMIINDVGPEVPKAALDFIHKVISQTYIFDTVQDLEKRMKKTRGLTWGPVTADQWRHMAEHNARALDDGRITYAYDPEISVVFEGEPTGAEDLWPHWDNITCPLLVLQGKQSMILTKKIIKQMNKRGPEFNFHVFKGCGHVPSLMAPDQIEVVRDWIQNPQEDI